MGGPFQLGHVVAVANKHPFYSPKHEYPLRPEEVKEIVAKEPFSNCIRCLLSQCPISHKDDIYKAMTRLAADDNPQNAFRQSTYISMTGGGGGSTAPLAFLTDIAENRAQRKACGELLTRLKALGENDCVLSMHTSGKMYRALDLITEVIEHTGASILPAGHLATPEELLAICNNFRPNILAGDTSQIIHFASFIESIGARDKLRFNKILYTSEPMTRLQRSYIQSVFGLESETPIVFLSLLASAEMGIWAVGNFALTGAQEEDTADFIFDSRHMIVEVLPLEYDFTPENRDCRCILAKETTGLLVVTSLQRLRNPLVRYLTGDVGSLHQLPASAKAILCKDFEHLRVLRLHGRDIRRSFKWEGEYFEFEGLKKIMSNSAWGVVRWQVVLTNDVLQPNRESLELRIMRIQEIDGLVSLGDLIAELMEYFYVHDVNKSLFHVIVASPEDFVRSKSGNKVILFVDQREARGKLINEEVGK